MQNEIRLLPARIVLGSKPVGITAEAHLVLQGANSISAVVEHIEIDDPDVEIQLASIEALPQGRTYLVRQKITKLCEHVSQVCFSARKANQTPTKVQVEICYRGEQTEKDIRKDAERKAP